MVPDQLFAGPVDRAQPRPETDGVPEAMARARVALASAQAVLHRDDLVPPAGPLEPADMHGALAAAGAAVRRDLRSESAPPDRRPHLATALVHLGGARVELRAAQAEARAATDRRVCALLDGLRSATTIPELVDAIPAALGRFDYYRGMVSQVRQGRWITLSTYVRDNPDQATAMTDIGGRVARPVDARLVEHDMLAGKRPIVVLDAPGNGRVHPELLALTGVRSYVAAPIVVGDGVAGFLHADRTHRDRGIAPTDAMLLAAVGEVLSFAVERAALDRRLRRITDLVREPDEELTLRITQARESGPGRPAGAGAPAEGEVPTPRLSQLSARELEVVHHLATGAGNTSIAIRMGIAETTVKSHVKHIIRKLGVANRAEAIALYLRSSPPRR